jgi:hypothetical protein
MVGPIQSTIALPLVGKSGAGILQAGKEAISTHTLNQKLDSADTKKSSTKRPFRIADSVPGDLHAHLHGDKLLLPKEIAEPLRKDGVCGNQVEATT